VAEKQSTGVQTQLKDQFVTAIVVTHDGVTWLNEVVASLSSQKHKIDQIIAVDNGSIDDSVKLLNKAGIEVIKKSRRTGFGAAVAAAVAKLPPLEDSGNIQEWLWILHDDCAPDRHALGKLLEAVISRPQVGIAGPKILGWYDRKHILEAGISITENGTRWTGLEEREHDQGQHDEVKTVLAVSTAGMLVKRSLFEELGGFDPSLELFRDDIDLGWRANIAGYSVICVGEAILYHAEAAASERRSVDVKDAILHRPLLLDRRNAALVLLANSSWWILPWVAIQLLFTSLGRAILYLLAKLPGYAADEIAAIGLLIFKPSDLIKSRRYRKSSRVLTARVIKPFIPNRSIQIRTIFGRISSSLSGLFKSSKQEIAVASPSSYSDIGVIDESFDEIDFPAKQSFSKLRSLIKQPFLFGVLVTLIISVLYSRNRLGSLSGGAMAVAPASAIELITSYVNSWHLVGLGSSSSAPAWIPIIGIASFITAGNPQVFLAVLFFFAPTLLFIFSYRTARKYSLTNYSSVFVGFIYALSPVTLTSINQGRLGTLVIALILPGLFTLLEKNRGLINIGWRKVFAIALIAGLAGAFSPLFLAAWIVFQIGVILYTYTKGANWKTKVISEIRENLSNEEFKKRLALMFMPVLINVPNSITLLLHPIKSLREPGLSLESAGPLSTILFNPGGPSAPAIYVLAPFLLYILIGIFSRDQKNSAISALLAISLAATFSSFFIQGNNSQAQRIWSGPLVLFAQLLSLLLIFAIAERIIPQLRVSNFGFRHIASVFTALVTIVSMVTISIWVTSAGANSVLRANQEQVIPPFITDLASTDERPKTLVIRKSDDQLQYFVTRGGDLQIGNADVASQTPEQFHKAIVDLVNGVGGSTSQVLGFYGIKYVYMKNPADAGLTRTIDGIGGFTRSSATKDGIVWKVDKSHARVTFQNKQGQFLSVNSTDKSSKAYVSGAGLILLAEKYDKAWHLMLNGKPVPLQEHPFGIPIFEIQEQGEILLTHDGTNRRAWISLQLIALISTIVLALPAGRRRREVPLEELL
jgi:GT2 family glycosyltransferase